MHIAYAKKLVSHESVRLIIKQSYSDFSNFCIPTINRNHQEKDTYRRSFIKILLCISLQISDQKHSFIKDKCPVVK